MAPFTAGRGTWRADSDFLLLQGGGKCSAPGPPLIPEKRGSRSVLSARPASHDPCHPLDFQVGLEADFSECPADARREDSADYPLLMLLVGMKSSSH